MKPISRRAYAIAAVILAAVIFVAVNIAANTGLTDSKLDLTENGQFTLSQGTKHIIAQLKEPITLRFFYSKKTASDYAQIDAYARRVRDMLQEYAARSDGKIILQDVDPEPFTPEEDEATANGLTGAPTDSGTAVYFGLLASNTVGDKEVVPFFTAEREPYLEYDLSALIYRLSHPRKAKIAVLTSLPLDGGMQMMMQGGAQPNMIYQQLQQSYDTQMLDQDFTKIPAGTDVLVIVQPPVIALPQKLAIDQFVMGGGHALVFLDPNSEMAQMANGGAPSASSLPALLKAWGVAYNPKKVLGDRLLAQQVQTSGDPRNPTARYPIWLHLNADDFNKTDQVTAQLQTVNLASAGAFSPLKGATTKFTPLMSSSDQASLLDAPLVQMTPRPQDLWNLIRPAGSPYTIAARITGPAKSAFPQVAPIKSAKDINVIVVADSDIFDDRFWVRTQDLFGKRIAQPFADNVAFVLNAVENLTGSSDLISLRTRASSDRPFTVVKQMQAEAQAQYQQEADALQARLSDTEQRLHALEQGEAANGQNAKTLTPAQKSEIEKFKHDLINTRAQLRDVQARLRSDIDALGSILAFINIALVPILVALFALVMAGLRRRRRAKAVKA
ncbi:MAG: Gldg family protein [Proteobacteria bacterium]|nr:Gldg family protein [Pseudomonadota bacterium]